jgi:hypothetical protein
VICAQFVRYSAKLISRLRADVRDTGTEKASFGSDADNDDDGTSSAASIGSSVISLVSSTGTRSGVDSSTSRPYHQLESEVTRLTFELNRVRQSEKLIKEQYQTLVDDRATGTNAGAPENRHQRYSFSVSPVHEGQEHLGEHSDDEGGGSSATSFDSALDDGAGPTDPRTIASVAISESARLRKELGMVRAEAAAALAMEHGKRTAVAEAHRAAHATTVRQAAELRDAHAEIASLRQRLTFEAVRSLSSGSDCMLDTSFDRHVYLCCARSLPGLSWSNSCLWLSKMRGISQQRL